jgi:hypothetical protein
MILQKLLVLITEVDRDKWFVFLVRTPPENGTQTQVVVFEYWKIFVYGSNPHGGTRKSAEAGFCA